MKELIEFLSSYVPEYRQVTCGHDSVDVARVEAALGQPLPSFYRDFLETSAANLGYLIHEFDFDVEELIDLIEMKTRMLKSLGGRVIPVAVDGTISHSDYYIHLDRPALHSPGDGELVRSAAGGRDFDDIKTGYEGFRDLLYCRGYRAVRMLPLRQRSFVSWPARGPVDAYRLIDQLRIRFEALGFMALGLTGPRNSLFERGDAAAVGQVGIRSDFISAYLAARDRSELGRITETLLDQMPVEGKQKSVAPL